MATHLALIAAFGHSGQVGLDGNLPWHIPQELKLFKDTTTPHPIIMGRRTFESIGRPLPGRTNIVISTSLSYLPGATVVSSLEEAIEAVKNDKLAFVIGGPQVWETALPKVSSMVLSEVSYDDKADAYLSEDFFARLRKEFVLNNIKIHEGFTTSYWSRPGKRPA